MAQAPSIQVEVDIRCAYCGLDHKILVRVWLTEQGRVIAASSLSEGCDVLDWRTHSIIEADR